MWKTMLSVLVSSFLLHGCGDEDSCKNACDTVKSCGLKTSGLSCSSDDCKESDEDCAACIDVSTCDEIRTGACASACPGVSF